MMTRRAAVAAGLAAMLSACARPDAFVSRAALPEPPAPPPPPLPAFYGAIDDEPFPVPAIPPGVVPPRLWRQRVTNPFTAEPPGSIVVDPDAGLLHLVEAGGSAMRYGAGTGADAHAWHGVGRLQFTRAWPRWRAPDEMIARRPEFAPYSVANGGMAPGPGNPLGARALYIFQDRRDTLYRIHGACEPEYLGKPVSSGCIRLLDQDAIDLAERAPHGARITVLRSLRPRGLPMLY